MIRSRIAILFFLLTCAAAHGQNLKADSLRVALRQLGADTSRVNALNDLGWELKNVKTDSAIALGMQALALSRQLHYGKGYEHTLHNLGVYFFRKQDFKKALEYDQCSLRACDSLSKTADVLHARYYENASAGTLGNVGAVYKEQGLYSKALECYFQTLELAEKLHLHTLRSNTLSSIGTVYQETNEYDKSVDYYLRALHLADSIHNPGQSATVLGNLGVVYWNKKEYSKALGYDSMALALEVKLGNQYGIARHLGNMGAVYKDMGDFKKAMEHYQQALALHTALNNRRSMAIVLGNMGELYLGFKKYTQAKEYLERALKLTREIGALNLTRVNYQQLSELYEQQQQWGPAYAYYKKFIAARDSIFNEENTKKQTQSEMQFAFAKQQAADSIRNAEQLKQESLRHEQEIGQQRLYTYGGAIGFVLMLVVAAVSFNAYRSKQRANEVISRQKQLVEAKQREVLDSIYYAKRIQQSLMPTERYIEKQLKRKKDN
jgi:tetratricopeptide (TPR) repeat protein